MSQWRRDVDIQKAVPYEERRLLTKYWKPPWIVQPKLDGDRLRIKIDKHGVVEMLTSEANDMWTVPHIRTQIEESGLRDIELDGEAYKHGLPQNKIHGIVSSQRATLHPDYESINFHIFDIVDEGRAQHLRTAQLASNYLNWFGKARNVIYVPFYLAYTIDEIDTLFKLFISQGYEGFIIRHAAQPYYRSRSAHVMQKFKPKKEDVYLIEEVLQAIDKDGKPKGMAGAFWCSAPPNPKRFKVSAGNLTHEERTAVWEMARLIEGLPIKVGYQHLTEARGVPRHGTAIEILYGETLNTGGF